MKLESKDNYKETRLIKLSKSFDEIVYQKTLSLFNEKIIKRKGSCKEINKMEFYVNYKPEKKPITPPIHNPCHNLILLVFMVSLPNTFNILNMAKINNTASIFL